MQWYYRQIQVSILAKIEERFTARLKTKYAKKGLAWETSDEIFIYFWFKVMPWIVWIPLFFWLLKWTFMDFMYNKYGFEKTIIFLAIIMIVKPTIMEVITKIMTFKEKIKEKF